MDVGVRELRGNLSRFLGDVRDGAEITVTDHGRPIARIVPIERTIDRLIREGRVTPALEPRTPLPKPIRAKGTVSDLISAQRD